MSHRDDHIVAENAGIGIAVENRSGTQLREWVIVCIDLGP